MFPVLFRYTLRKKQFFSNFWTITMFAVLGTLISTFFVGFMTFWLGKMGIIPIDSRNPMEALIFGSLISAVDPVATLSIIGSVDVTWTANHHNHHHHYHHYHQ
jgi:solute carrier family 9 (sodium/hydrogen exchanger), member 8